MSFPICEKCTQGFILPGEPTGSMQRVKNATHDAYFAPKPTAEGSKAARISPKSAVVLLTDMFGLPLVNSKLLADRHAKELGCDVWVPDMFNGSPPIGINEMNGLTPERPGESTGIFAKLQFFWLILKNLPALLFTHSPAKGAERTEAFIHSLKEEKGYDKIGITGYCFGGSVGIILASKPDLVTSAVINHPGRCNIEQIKAMKVPSSWQCAEEDMSFKPELRNSAEVEFKGREGKDSFVEYEFADYPGTVHGFAARPNMAIAEAKSGFEKAFAAGIAWFKRTLA